MAPTDAQVKAAEADVLFALRSAYYAPDARGFPVDVTLRTAALAAVDVQAAARAAADALLEATRGAAQDNPMGVALQSASIGSASWTAASGQEAAAAQIAPELMIPRSGGLCRRAYEILVTATLLPGVIYAHG